jgi:lysophospholipase
MFPGRTEYIEKYAVTAGDFAAHDYGMFTVDWRGQGLADRVAGDPMVGHIDDFASYQRDVDTAVQAAEALGLPKPWYLLGHSMGGCIGLRALYRGLDVKAAAFSGPMWGVGSTALVRFFGKMLGGAVTKIGMGEHFAPGGSREIYVLHDTFPDNALTTDSAMYVRMQDQARANPELVVAGFSYQWVYEAIKETERLALIPSPNLPCLTIVGTDEAIVNPVGFETRMARWPVGKLMVIPRGQHEVLMDSAKMRGPAIAAMADLFSQHR